MHAPGISSPSLQALPMDHPSKVQQTDGHCQGQQESSGARGSELICIVQRPGKRKSKSPGPPSALESQPVLILSLLQQELGKCHFLLPVVTAALPAMAADTEGSSEALLSSPPAIATSAFPAVYSSANLLLEPW